MNEKFLNYGGNNPSENWSTTHNQNTATKSEEDSEEKSETEQWIEDHQRYDNSGFAKMTGLDFYGGMYLHYPDEYDEISVGIERGQFPEGLIDRLNRVTLKIPTQRHGTLMIDFYRSDPLSMGLFDEPPKTYECLNREHSELCETLEEIVNAQSWVPSDDYDTVVCSNCGVPQTTNENGKDVTEHEEDCVFGKAKRKLNQINSD